MTDAPTDPTDQGADAETKAWYARPVTWIAGALVVALVVVVIVVTRSDSDTTETSSTIPAATDTTIEATPTTIEATDTTLEAPTTTEATDTTVEATTTTVEPGTTTPGPTPVAIAESPLRADLLRVDPTDYEMPFVDGEVQAHWYQSGGTYVVVYAGWDARRGDPQCPGSLFYTAEAEYEFISNSPQVAGACDPEDRYETIIPLDDPMGVRVCGTLVLNHTIIPVTNDDGSMREGDLYATVERIFDGGFVSATGFVPTDGVVVAELDTTADAYSVPDGWLPDGATTVTC